MQNLRSGLFFFMALASLAGCGRETEPTDVKFAGVGLDPDQISTAPEDYGGVVEYSWINFGGAGLPLALSGLIGYDAVGASLAGFKAPYAMVTGLGFIMDTDLPAPDALVGSFAVPPPTPGTCQTVYEPFSFLNNLADVGNTVRFRSEDGTVGVDFGRNPEIYPPDPQDLFTYYFGLETWRPTVQTHYVPAEGSDDREDMSSEVFRPANFVFGETVSMSFAGGMPPADAAGASIPVPLAAAGSDTTLKLPSDPQGVWMSWTGPVFDADGVEPVDDKGDVDRGEHKTCLQYLPNPEEPEGPEQCATLPEWSGSTPSQMYTGPWDAEDGITFRWIPPAEGGEETVSLTVRFLGPVDPTYEYLQSASVPVAANPTVQEAWTLDQENGNAPSDEDAPEGTRAPLACEDPEDVDYGLSPAYTTASGDYVPTLQGDPSTKLAEVTCNLDETPNEDGYAEFTLTGNMLADALAYGQLHGAEGAIFYFTRSTTTPILTPPVRDNTGKRHDISPVVVVSRALVLGRFWYDL